MKRTYVRGLLALLLTVALLSVGGTAKPDTSNISGSGAKDGYKIVLTGAPLNLPDGGRIYLTATLTFPPEVNEADIRVSFSCGGALHTPSNKTCSTYTDKATPGRYRFTAAAPDFGVSNEIEVIVGGGGDDAPGGGGGGSRPGSGAPEITLDAIPSAASEGETVSLIATLRQADRSLAPAGTSVSILRDGDLLTNPPLQTGTGTALGKAGLDDIPFPAGNTDKTRRYDATSPDYNPGHTTVTKLPSKSLNLQDKIWGGRGDDQTDDPDTYDAGRLASQIVVGPKSLGTDADQMARIKFNVAGATAGNHYHWAIKSIGGVGLKSGDGKEGTVNDLTAGAYYLEMWEDESPYYRRINFDIPAVNITTFEPIPNSQIEAVSEQNEEGLGAKVTMSGNGLQVDSTLLGMGISAARYPRTLRWDDQKLNVWENQSSIWIRKTTPLSLSAHDSTMSYSIRSTASLQKGQSSWATLEVKSPSVTLKDRIKFLRKYRSVVIAFLGHDQTTQTAGPGVGIQTISSELMTAGYDVRIFAPDAAADTAPYGAKEAYDLVTSLIDQGAIDQVAIFGYSHGGGATYNLASALQSNINYMGRIAFTAYIDGVERESSIVDFPFIWESEERLPPGSPRHDNLYQTANHGISIPHFPHGTSITGSSQTFFANSQINHLNVDDHPVAIDTIVTDLKAFASP